MRLEKFIKNEVEFGVTNYKSSISYNNIIKDIQNGKLKDEHSIISAARIINLVKCAMYFVEKHSETANKMFDIFNTKVGMYKSDLLFDFKFMNNSPEVKSFFWLLRETGSDMLTSNGSIPPYAERNDTFYRIDKCGTEHRIESISLDELQNSELMLKAS